MKVGICGYPGSGKSTVFSALAPGAASAKGGVAYGNIKVPDERIGQLAEIFSPKKSTYAEITFMDVGSTGGRFDAGAFPPDVLQHMRNADVLVHVVRNFQNPMLAEGPDPARDEGKFNDELVLVDHAVLERRAERFRKENAKGREREVTDRCVAALEDGIPLRDLELEPDHAATLTGIQLVSLKPLITLYNHGEGEWEEADASQTAFAERGVDAVSLGICAELEAELAELEGEDLAEMLEGLGLEQPARNAFVQAAYRLLDYISFLTAGPDECRAWPIRRGTVAKKAAGTIHSDIERGFIRAEVYKLADLLEHGSEAELKKVGKLRLEGKDYVMCDGDVANYRFNV